MNIPLIRTCCKLEKADKNIMPTFSYVQLPLNVDFFYFGWVSVLFSTFSKIKMYLFFLQFLLNIQN